MVRTIMWFIYFGYLLLMTLIPLQKVKKFARDQKIKEQEELVNEVARGWARKLVCFTGSTVKVIGEENVPKEGPVLFVSNHQGNFDIPILLGFVEKPKGFIAKKELEKMPILSTWMQYLHCVFMDRKDPREALRAINLGADLLKKGYSQVIFPEGTRSQDGRLGEFKPGSLKLALKAKVPVVPVTIKGSYGMMQKSSLRIHPMNVEVIISSPICTEDLSVKDSNQLTDQVKEIIGSQL